MTGKFIKDQGTSVQRTRDMKTSLPFPAFERKKHLTATIQIPEPLPALPVREM